MGFLLSAKKTNKPKSNKTTIIGIWTYKFKAWEKSTLHTFGIFIYIIGQNYIIIITKYAYLCYSKKRSQTE
jgi:hypothetical protein